MRRYRALAHAPHGPRLLVGAAVFYPGQAALGLVLLLALHRATGSFAAAGAAGAADTLGFSVSSLVQGRWIDRRGPRVLMAMTVTCALAITAINLALITGAGTPVLVGLAAAVGASIPAAGPSLRTVWSSLVHDPDQRATAFAYQSLAQDAGFVVGPAALGALAVSVSPALALSGCAVLIAAGAVTVATVPSPAAAARPPASSSERSVVVALAPLAAALATVGVTLGAIDVSIAAFATEHGSQQLAGVLLAAFSVGSIVGGFAYGGRSWRSGLPVRLLGCMLALAVLTLAPVASPGIALGAFALALAGVPLAATLTTAYLLAGERAPTGRQTEAYALLSLTSNGGAALGGALGGLLVASGSARPGFLLGALTPLLGVTILGLLGGPAQRPWRRSIACYPRSRARSESPS
jgi:MFS family permease